MNFPNYVTVKNFIKTYKELILEKKKKVKLKCEKCKVEM